MITWFSCLILCLLKILINKWFFNFSYKISFNSAFENPSIILDLDKDLIAFGISLLLWFLLLLFLYATLIPTLDASKLKRNDKN